MNETLKSIYERRSVRSYKSTPVDEKTLEEIIDAGLRAASGMNRQSAIILAITDKALRDRLSQANASVMNSDRDPFYGAPTVLVVLASKNSRTHIYDGSLVMGNLMLAAHSLGVSSCWIHRAREVFELPEWRAYLTSLGIGEEYEGIGNCILGYADGEIPPAKEINEGRVFFSR
jgi:nitroreductase